MSGRDCRRCASTAPSTRTPRSRKARSPSASASNGVVKIAGDDAFAMRVDALEAAIARDRAAGRVAVRDLGDRRHDVVRRRSIPCARIARDREARERLAARRRRLRRLRPRSVPSSAGCGTAIEARRLDRRQSAQVALHADRLQRALHAQARRAARDVLARPRVPEDDRHRRSELHGLRPPARPPLPRAQALVSSSSTTASRTMQSRDPRITSPTPRASPPSCRSATTSS